MSTSQLGQDLKVIEFYKNKTNGFFIEIGANDGIDLSNTYMLEKNYLWKGICCEPIPDKYKKLIINRPNSICCEKAIYNKSDLNVLFDIANNDDVFSGISLNIDCYKKYVNKNKTTITVKTITLEDLLDNCNAPLFIDYMSLDTEGSEYEILKPFNFNKYIFGLIDVEHNFIEPKRTQIKNLLLSNGYIYLGENKWDDMYKHSSLI